MLAGSIGGLLAMGKNQPWLAGLAMVVVLFKPDLLWPLPLLVFAAWSTDWGRALRFALASGATLLAGAGAGFWLVNGSGDFFSQFLNLESHLGSIRQEMAGIPLLFSQLPGANLIGFSIAIFGGVGVLGLAGLCFRGFKLPAWNDSERVMVPLAGLALWLACTTYVHPNDQILLVPLLIGLLGYGGKLVDGRWITGAGIACAAAMGAYLVFGLLGFGVLGVLVVGGLSYWKRGLGEAWMSLLLVAFIMFPVENQLTPVAVAGVALGGLVWLGKRFRSGEKLLEPALDIQNRVDVAQAVEQFDGAVVGV
jgi:hypothetical protein